MPKTHGMSGTRVYTTWISMNQRCYNPKASSYEYYGARGITVCRAWRESFVAFYRDMGEPPTSQHSIGRRDSNQGYSLSNCRWETPIEQNRNYSRNHRVTAFGKTLCLEEWAEHLNIPAYRIRARLKACLSPEEALTPHYRSNKFKTHCKRGHALSGDNLIVRRDGRECAQCAREHKLNWYQNNKKKEA